MTWVLVAIASAAAAVAVVVGLDRAEMRVAARHPEVQGARLRDTVLLGGVEGPGLPRLHGKGVLAVQGDNLVLVMASPPQHVTTIPVHQITTVDLTTALRVRGHWVRNRRHWLRVRWQTGEGVATIGLVVPEPALWARVLKHAAQRDTSG